MLKKGKTATTAIHTMAKVIAIFLSNVDIFLVKKQIIEYQSPNSKFVTE